MTKAKKIEFRTANKRSEQEKENDRVLIASLFLQNYTMKGIADKVNEKNLQAGLGYTLSFQQIHADIKIIMDGWREERMTYIDERISIEIAKLDRIEAECWAAWEASKIGKLKTRVDGGTVVDGRAIGGSVIDRTIETAVGDVRFLDRIQSCIDKRVELLGMSMPKKIDVTGEISTRGASELSDDEIRDEIRKLTVGIMKS